ncbi:FMN-dependent dehydrogenase-domain-containing protein [Gigaspora margarita]|uniref:FMN-dependent dehydrogenase-domain-containing protein n=1 Tax=Gigaspora margarita TaxID=4874 RepID=A0A8H4A3J1_GIGMA|nr:FMN-dependent dehydrogenase-domain-containing protein [Gigaspora margarita]
MILISAEEIAKHNTYQDCWIIIYDKVYNLSKFLPEHPGGVGVILEQAGKDATLAFSTIHSQEMIHRYLPSDACLGFVDPATVAETSKVEERRREAIKNRPSLNEILHLYDFEAVASRILTTETWSFYNCAAGDEISYRDNHYAFLRIWLRPRIMRDVTHIDMSTKILGYYSSFPLYISATALGKLGHPLGEVVLTRAAHSHGIIQMIPNFASCSLDEMTIARKEGQIQFFQLYINKNRDISRKVIQKAQEKGYKALVVTVDVPSVGNREKDVRMKYTGAPPGIQNEKDLNRDQGVLTPEDAILAAEYGCDGIVLSNHGGRQLDFAPSAIEVLPNVIEGLKKSGLLGKIEVYIDGGIRRGSDIFKAIALGAKAVGIGRPLLYAMSSYGQAGVERALQILKDEFETVMRLSGTNMIADICPNMIDSKSLSNHSLTPKDYLSSNVYDRLVPLRSKL